MVQGAVTSKTQIKIVSGGQTGVDRAALDAAIASHIPCGGWCPHDRKAEDGPISSKYPLTPLAGAGYRERTTKNVEESDGTAILFFGTLDGGTAATLEDSETQDKPHLLIDASTHTPDEAAQAIVEFVKREQIKTLNVAGPRASKQPAIYDYVLEAMTRALAELTVVGRLSGA